MSTIPAAEPVVPACAPDGPRDKRKQRRWSLGEQSAVLGPLLEARVRGKGNIRRSARGAGAPEATVRSWLKGIEATGVGADAAAFFLSPAGISWLSRILDAAIYAFTQTAKPGIRALVEFLERSRLSFFVASSYGAVQERVVQMEEHIGGFGAAESTRLAGPMPHRNITACEDETYHHKPCLVAIEPVSNYILCEQYEDGVDGDTWDHALETATAGLDVTVVQQTADEGRGLGRHAKNQDIHHSPDLFHPQQDITKATSGALARQVEGAEKGLHAAIADFCAIYAEAEAYIEDRAFNPRPGRSAPYP